MAAAAAAVAAASAAAALQQDRSRASADKQLDLLIKGVDTLEAVGFPKLRVMLERQAYAFGWSPYMLDLQTPRPAEGDLTEKERLDERNAYLTIMAKTDGHTVSSVLEHFPPGDAKGVFKALHEFFHNDSQAGSAKALRDFHSITMDNTNSNVVEWIAAVPRAAKAVQESGGQADGGAQLNVMLDGLSHQFDFIRKVLYAADNLTLEIARKKILNFAKQEGLELVTKGGAKAIKHNTFSVDDAQPKTPDRSQEPCRKWGAGKCTWGDKCNFSHAEREGHERGKRQPPHQPFQSTPGRPQRPQSTYVRPQAVPAAAHLTAGDSIFHYCNTNGHAMRACPVLQSDNRDGKSAVHLASADKGVDYVFFSEAAGAESDEAADDNNTKKTWFSILLAFIITLFFSVFVLTPSKLVASASKMVTRSPYKLAMLVVLMTLFLGHVLAEPTAPSNLADIARDEGANIQASSFFNSNNTKTHLPQSKELEWCSDSGTNRFVTNDSNDFVQGTIQDTPTIVAVGGGNVTSPSFGTVIIESLDHGCTLQCLDVLYIPQCSKKLMPASPFVRKGCSVVLDDYDKVTLRSKDGAIILSGQEIGGLYYYRCKTVHDAKPANSSATAHGAPTTTSTPKVTTTAPAPESTANT